MRSSPFPGMDPYLEDPPRWSGVHSRLINTISDDLADRLSPHFYVDIESRVYVIAPDDPARWPIVPDIYLVRGAGGARSPAPAGAITAPTLIEPVYDLEVRESFIVIRDSASRAVVTTLEVLSPFNKAPGSPGQEAYLRKRNAAMASTSHWIEIDLLRAGKRPDELASQSDYYALLHRGGTIGPHEVWFFDLRDRMPTIAVPLTPALPDLPLDLQRLFDTVYARGHYAESTDYTRAVPPPRLRPADAAWVAARVHDWLAQGQDAGTV